GGVAPWLIRSMTALVHTVETLDTFESMSMSQVAKCPYSCVATPREPNRLAGMTMSTAMIGALAASTVEAPGSTTEMAESIELTMRSAETFGSPRQGANGSPLPASVIISATGPTRISAVL